MIPINIQKHLIFKKKMYVVDLLTEVENDSKILTFAKNIKYILNKVCFNSRKWNYNYPEVLKQIACKNAITIFLTFMVL